MTLRAGITHMTDSGPACPACGQDGLWGYAPFCPPRRTAPIGPALYIPGNASEGGCPASYYPQCGSCHHAEDILSVPGDDHANIAAIRAAHQRRTDR